MIIHIVILSGRSCNAFRCTNGRVCSLLPANHWTASMSHDVLATVQRLHVLRDVCMLDSCECSVI